MNRSLDKSDVKYINGMKITNDIKQSFNENGYIILRNLLDNEEMTKLKTALESDDGIMNHQYSVGDGAGRKVTMALWKHPGKDITGIIARSEKFATTFEELLGGEVYHYHSKLMMKKPRSGGAHIWHQDYGYWYENGFVFPDMGTVWVAVDKADKENGCLQLLAGSHKCGRVDHIRVGDQVGADPERVNQVKKFCPLLDVEVQPGDCVLFHSNLLHKAERNDSDRRRWAYLIAYCRADNNPVYEHFLPSYTPLHKVPNDAIRQCSTETCLEGKDFHTAPGSEPSIVNMTKKQTQQ